MVVDLFSRELKLLDNGILDDPEFKKPKSSKIGNRGDSILDIVPRGWLFYAQFLKEFYILRQIRKGDVVVDMGCGTAALMEKIYRNGIKATYIGIDCSLPALSKRAHLLEKRDTYALVRADILDTPLKDDVADVIVLSEVIEHFYPEYQEAVMLECRRVAKPGCKLILTTTISGEKKIPGHVGEIKYEDALALLESTGWKPIQSFGLYSDDTSVWSDAEREVYESLRKFYPPQFLKALLCLNYPESSRSYMIEAEVEK